MATTKTPPKNRIGSNGAAALLPTGELFALERLRIKVIGITPLLCANPSGMQPPTEGPTRVTKADEKKPAVICRKAAYWDAEGHCAFPNVALHSAILAGASMMKLRVSGDKYALGIAGILGAGLMFDYRTVLVKLVHPVTMQPLTEKDYQIDMQRAVNQKTGGAIVAIRPRFDKWAAIFDFLVDSRNADLMQVLDKFLPQVLDFTGMNIAIGAYRAFVEPKGDKKRRPGGPYGKFSAKVFDS